MPLLSLRLQVLPVPPDAGGLRAVGPHLPSGVRGGGAGGREAQRCLRAEQGAAVEDVEPGGRPAHRHHHAGGRALSFSGCVRKLKC